MHIEHKAGDKMYIDFAGKKLHVVHPDTGEIQDVEVFLSVLGASQLTYIEAIESQQKEDFISCCETGKKARSDGENGYSVVKILEEAEKIMLGEKVKQLDEFNFALSRLKK